MLGYGLGFGFFFMRITSWEVDLPAESVIGLEPNCLLTPAPQGWGDLGAAWEAGAALRACRKQLGGKCCGTPAMELASAPLHRQACEHHSIHSLQLQLAKYVK